MMKLTGSDDYFLHKVTLLKQFLSISEEFLSSLEDWVSYDAQISKREYLIDQLQKLDDLFDEKAIRSCSQSQKSEIDHLVNLILAVDKDISNSIEREKELTIQSIKANIQGKRIAGYAHTLLQSSKFVDFKK